jgi:1-deoxy-D-xylulose-5-phosphate synthase
MLTGSGAGRRPRRHSCVGAESAHDCVRCRPFEHLASVPRSALRWRPRARGEDVQGDRRHRRWRNDGRHGLRGDGTMHRSTGADLLVVLNDNHMSISRNEGGLASYFARMHGPAAPTTTCCEAGKRVLSRLPGPALRDRAAHRGTHVKGMIAPGTLFEELGFAYSGPVDGHDMPALLATVHGAAVSAGPSSAARGDAQGPGLCTGRERSDQVSRGRAVRSIDRDRCQRGTADLHADLRRLAVRPPPRPCAGISSAITPAMREGSGHGALRRAVPRALHRRRHRGAACRDPCRRHGLRSAMRPVVAIYSTFLQRAYDQLIHDVAIQNGCR